MSKDVSTYPESAITPDTGTSSTVSGIEAPDASTLMDNYANGLMDELFNDVEYALEEGLELPTDTVEVEEPEPVATPHIVLPAALVHPPSSALSTIEDDDESSELALVRDELEKAKRRERKLDFLLLGAAFTALVLTAGIWLSNRQNNQGVPTSKPPLSPEEVQAQSDAEFLAYLDRSLELIDRRAAMQPPTATAASANGSAGATAATASTLPPVLVPGSSTGQPLIPQGSGSGQRVIERVYVPLYQPPGSSAPIATATAPGTVPFRNIAETYGNATASLPSANSSSAAASSPASPAPSSNQQAANSAPAPTPGNHTLVGVMELGDRSAALFDIDGSTQRFFAGEAIASSGWTLVTVSNQEAIIRRNGEIRSVYVGQKF